MLDRVIDEVHDHLAYELSIHGNHGETVVGAVRQLVFAKSVTLAVNSLADYFVEDFGGFAR